MPIALRPPFSSPTAPSTSTNTSATPTTSPPLPFLLGTWHVTHSTLPMWSSKRNVRITYSTLPASPSFKGTEAMETDRLDDLVEYQSLGSDKVKTVTGIDTATHGGEGNTGIWDWRGKGWLKVASSHWEVLGWGGSSSSSTSSTAASAPAEGDDVGEGPAWAVTYFEKTLFTPAGIDVYSRVKEGLPKELFEEIKTAIGEVPDERVKALKEKLFEVTRN